MNTKEYDSLYALLEAFPTEDACIEHLEQLRWPKGIICQVISVDGGMGHLNPAYMGQAY